MELNPRDAEPSSVLRYLSNTEINADAQKAPSSLMIRNNDSAQTPASPLQPGDDHLGRKRNKRKAGQKSSRKERERRRKQREEEEMRVERRRKGKVNIGTKIQIQI